MLGRGSLEPAAELERLVHQPAHLTDQLAVDGLELLVARRLDEESVERAVDLEEPLGVAAVTAAAAVEDRDGGPVYGTALVRAPSSRLAEGIVTHIARSPLDVALAREQHAAYAEAVAAACVAAGAVGLARDLANMPSGRKTPAWLAGEAARVAAAALDAGALIGSAREGADAKLAALAAAGCRIVKGPEEAVTMLSELSELR